MFIFTQDTLINTELLEAVTTDGSTVTFHMTNNDISLTYKSDKVAKQAVMDTLNALRD